MLKDHKNFCFAPISYKANDLIFLKRPKKLFFQKNTALSQITKYGAQHYTKF